ncbi:MAG: DUF3078 domain-containing protein [Bacteroidales bacterium]|nr:DUF3078 domain-containing protein [Bacteroidales bacterium]
MIRLPFFLLAIIMVTNTYAQSNSSTETPAVDSVSATPQFSTASAWKYIHDITESRTIWKSKEDSVKHALERLLDHTTEPFDSVQQHLSGMDFHAIEVFIIDFLVRDSMRIRWLNDSTFIVDSLGWNMELFMKEKFETRNPVDFSSLAFSDFILDENGIPDTNLFIPDTLLIMIIDTAALETLQVPMYLYTSEQITPPLDDPEHRRSARISPDSTALVFTDTIASWIADNNSPFLFLAGENQLDSLQYALETLLAFNARRDSSRLLINDMYGRKTPFWITTGNNESQRFWVKNYKNDSITLWIGNPAKDEISLLLEDDIDFNRLVKQEMDHLPRVIPEPERSFVKTQMLESVPVFWDYEISAAYSFNQTYLSNWAKGGENSLTTMLDMTGAATYNNTKTKIQWINSARLKFGTLITEEHGLRKNNDLLEINSQYNKNKWGKVDLSASFYMKNQLAKGYSYPNDSVVVSKFLNPGSLTIGLGIDYKPFKNTSINMAPLSYKNTFVLDTANIDQTKHGIKKDKRARQEMGTQLLIKNKLSPMEDLTITNQLRLFSNYLNHPENIDIDWEMLIDKKISWFFTIRLNLHLIYDDDIRFPVLDADGQPVFLPDGSEKKVPKVQFKEFIGLSLLFKF